MLYRKGGCNHERNCRILRISPPLRFVLRLRLQKGHYGKFVNSISTETTSSPSVLLISDFPRESCIYIQHQTTNKRSLLSFPCLVTCTLLCYTKTTEISVYLPLASFELRRITLTALQLQKERLPQLCVIAFSLNRQTRRYSFK